MSMWAVHPPMQMRTFALAAVLALTLVTSGCLSGLLEGDKATIVFEVTTPADSDAEGLNGSDIGDFSTLKVRINYAHAKPADKTNTRWAKVDQTVDLVDLAGTDGTSIARVVVNDTKAYQRFGLALSVEQAVLRNGTSVNVSHLEGYRVVHEAPEHVTAEEGKTLHYRFELVVLLNDEEIPGPDGEYFLMVPQWRSGPVTS